jgi:hypothetical protein
MKHHDVRTYRGVDVRITLLIPNFSIDEDEWPVYAKASSTPPPQPLRTGGGGVGYVLDRRVDGFQSWSECAL